MTQTPDDETSGARIGQVASDDFDPGTMLG